MKRTLLQLTALFVLSTLITNVQAQSPGGVGTANLTAWWNPDVLPIGNVTSWTTIYPTGASAITLSDASAPYAIATNTPTNNTSNYNTTLNFAGNGTGNLPAASSRALEFIGTLNLLDNRISTSQGTFFSAHYINDVGSGGQHIVDYRESVGDAIQFRWLSPTVTRMAIGTSGQSVNASRNIADDGKPIIISYFGNRSSATSLNTRRRSQDITVATSSQAGTGGRIGLVVGARKNGNGTYGGSHRSYINELIFFNTDLSFIDLIRVESYLAIKYGTTLESTATSGGAYLTSNPAISSWTPALPYHNDVIGIGRDDVSTLQQKQSHSFDDSLRIYLGSLALTNAANASTFTNNIAYAVIAHNLGANNETAAATAEMPAGQNLVNRIDREWRVQNTNLSDNFSLDITLNNFTNFSSNPGDLVLLVDDDGNFSNASVFQSGLSFSVNGNTVTVSGISNTQIPLNSTNFLTLATIAIPAPVQLKTFNAKAENKVINLNWEVATEENFDHYSIEHSMDLNNWETIGQVTGKGSNSKYTYTHENPVLGHNYYRLKMIDIDHKTAYSWNSKVNITSEDVIKIYPNPLTKNTLWIEANNNSLQKLSIKNLFGQEVSNQIEQLFISDHYMRLDLSRIPDGLYFVKIGNNTYSVVK